MKNASLLAAATVVLLANAFALVHVWGNRTGAADSDITLSERELTESYNPNNEDSGVTLTLRWTSPGWVFSLAEVGPAWLDPARLRELGFDTSVEPADKAASEFYSRQLPRRAFVALEFDGPGWRTLLGDIERNARTQSPNGLTEPGDLHETSSRLVVIDAASEAGQLRARHPDRHGIVIAPAVIRIDVLYRGKSQPPRLGGSVQDLPTSIHVPLPFSEAFRRSARNSARAMYRVRLRYGPQLEPWVVGVEFSPPGAR